MVRLLAVVMLGSVAFAQSSPSGGQLQSLATVNTVAGAKITSGNATGLPPMPPGRSSVIGGQIRNVDPVRDQFTLKVFGGRPMKILFDERTQVYRDGVRIPLHDLTADDHASIETALDGNDIFALRIHMLSKSPEGECQGQVLNFNPATGDLTVSAALSRERITLRVPAGVSIVAAGQAAASATPSGPANLVKGALVSIRFRSGAGGRGIATNISLLATPGAAFVFRGNLTFFDLHAGRMTIVDPRDNQSYQVSFDAARLPESRALHPGDHVAVTTTFDGSRYVANSIHVD